MQYNIDIYTRCLGITGATAVKMVLEWTGVKADQGKGQPSYWVPSRISEISTRRTHHLGTLSSFLTAHFMYWTL